MALANLRSVLAVRDFRRLYATRLLGQFADGLLQAALATFVLFSPERQPTAASVAGAFAVLFLPYSLVGPFAGVFLDEWRRQRVLVWANLLRGVLVIGVGVLIAARHEGLSLAAMVLVVLGVGRFVLAGLSASLPHVVDGPFLVTANALTPTSGTIAAAVGGLLGVVIRGLAGGGDGGSIVVLACSIAAYAAAALMATRIGRDRLGPDEDTVRSTVLGVLRGFAEGLHELRRHRLASAAVAVVVVQRIAFGALTVIGLLLIRNTLNPSIDADAALAQFALVTGAAAAGALIGAYLTPGRARRLGFVRWTVLAVAPAAVLSTAGLFLAVALATLWPLLVAAFSVGFANQCAKVSSDTLVQRDCDGDYLGRVFALFDVLVNVALVAGVCAVAFTAPESGITPVAYVLVGVLIAVNAGWYAALGARVRP